jgi:hypothetical protein
MSVLGKTASAGATVLGLLVGALALTSPAAGAAAPVGCDGQVLAASGTLTPDAISVDGSTVVFGSGGTITVHDVASGTEVDVASGRSPRLADGGTVVFYEAGTAVRSVGIDGEGDQLVADAAGDDEVVLLDAASDADAALAGRGPQEGTWDIPLISEALVWNGAVLTVHPTSPSNPGGSRLVLGGTISPDGATYALNGIDSDAGRPIGTLLVRNGGSGAFESVAQPATDLRLVGDTPTVFYGQAPAGPLGTVTSWIRALDLDGEATDEEVAASAYLLDVAEDADHLLVTDIAPPYASENAGLPRTYLPARHDIARDRRVPFAVRLGTGRVASVVVGSLADGGRRIAFQTSDGRVALADCTSFADVRPSQAFAEDIEWVFAAGITTGYDDSTYRPTRQVTRQAMAAFLHRLSGDPDPDAPAEPPFTDVSLDHPFLLDITWAVEAEVTTGYADDTFRPSAPVTRQAMAAFLHRVTGEAGTPGPGTPTFTDVSAGHPFFADVQWMAANDISEGYQPGPTYQPSALVTRQAMAAFLHRTADLLET